MAAFETLIEAIGNWFRDLLLGILGRHAEEIVTDYVRRKRSRRREKEKKERSQSKGNAK